MSDSANAMIHRISELLLDPQVVLVAISARLLCLIPVLALGLCGQFASFGEIRRCTCLRSGAVLWPWIRGWDPCRVELA